MDGKLSNLVSIPSLAWSLTVFVALGYLARRLHVCPFSFLTKTLGCRRVILLMVTGALALVLLPSYYVLILRWGTVNPYFVLSRTAPATWPNGQRPGPATASARNWRPPERLVVSLTSLPHRIITSDFRSVIDSLFRQTLLPDAIYLSLPQRSRGNTTFSNEHIASIPTRITVLRPEVDLGPVMKLVPVLKVEKEPGTIIVTLDDDQIYHPDLLRLLAWNAVHRPEAAHGACGWGFLWVWPIGVTQVYVPMFLRGDAGRKVDVLQACCGIAYRRRFFNVSLVERIAANCSTTDDIWLSGYLATVANVSRIVVGEYAPTRNPAMKQRRPDTHRLAKINNWCSGNDMRCIKKIQDLFGEWPLAAHAR